MNYIELINKFWRSHEEHSFSTTEIAFYFHLLDICNSCHWKNPFKRRNNKIEADLNISYNTLKNARNKLAQFYLISFKSQNGNSNVVYSLSNFDEVTNEVDNGVSDINTTSSNFDEVSNEVSVKVSNEVNTEVLPDININKTESKTETKEIEIEKKAELNFPFSSSLFLDKWNLLASSPKWIVKSPLSLQISLDGLQKFDEAFVLEMIDQAIVGDWSHFKGVELSEQYTKWKNQKEKPIKPAKESKARFRPPTLEEVKAYCLERKNKVDPEKFIDFYTARGWKYNNTKISDWEACVRTWEKNDFDNGKSIIGNNQKLSEAYQKYQDSKETGAKLINEYPKNESLKVTPQEYRQMKDNGIEIKKDITPEELEEIRKKLKEL